MRKAIAVAVTFLVSSVFVGLSVAQYNAQNNNYPNQNERYPTQTYPSQPQYLPQNTTETQKSDAEIKAAADRQRSSCISGCRMSYPNSNQTVERGQCESSCY